MGYVMLRRRVDLEKNQTGYKGKGGELFWLGPAGYKIIEEVSKTNPHASVWKLFRYDTMIAVLNSAMKIIRIYK